MDDDIWLKKGYFVELTFPGAPDDNYYEITAAEPFEYETGTEDTAIFSAVSSGSDSGYKNIELLEPDDVPPHLFQVLWGVKDTQVKYYLKLPTGTNRMGVDEDKDIGFITAEKSPYYAPNPLYQFWLLHAWYPSIKAVNESPVTITPKIWFKGMKYDIKKVGGETLELLKAGKLPCRRIEIGGVRTSS
jgi:hypothetical protein